MPEVGKVKIRNVELTINANSGGRWWIADDEGNTLGSGEKLEAAKAQASATLRKRAVKVNVPFVTKAGKRGVADSIHAGTRKVLVTVDGKREQTDGYGTREVFKPEIPVETLTRYREIGEARNALYAEAKRIEDEWTFSLVDAVNDAVEEAVSE